MRSAALVLPAMLALALGREAGSAAPKTSAARAATIAEAWRSLPKTGSACGDDLVFDYGVGGGMRNFFCRALTVLSWKTFLSLAPAEPFASGPHKPGKLDLKAERDFGRYNPEFVRWATVALVPAAKDPTLRRQTQTIYDAQVRSLARLYFKVWRVLSSHPAWLDAEVRFYLGAIDRGDAEALGASMDLYHDVLGTADQEWGGNDPNHVRSATLWWLRRQHDGTAAIWVEGLERLLLAYDESWLAAEKRRKPGSPPVRQEPGEYR